MPFRARCNPANLLQRRHAVLALRKARTPLLSSAQLIHEPIRNDVMHHTRLSSTTSLLSPFTSFFSRARKSQTPEAAAEDFANALETRSFEAMSKAYRTVVNDAIPSNLLSEEQLLSAMKALAESTTKTPKALRLLRRMYEDFPTRFGYPLRRDHGLVVLRGLVNCGMVREALKVALSMDQKDVDWRLMLRAAVDADIALSDIIIQRFRQTTPLNQEDYILLLRIIRSHPNQNKKRLEPLLAEMEQEGVTLDQNILAEVMQVHIACGELEKAKQIMEKWDFFTLEGVGPRMWDAQVQYYIAVHDLSKLQTAVLSMRDAGLTVQQNAILALALEQLNQFIDSKSKVLYSDVIAAIHAAEQMAGTEPGSKVWAEVIRHYLQNVRHREALEVAIRLYEECQGRGVTLDVELARTLIIPLCSSRKQIRLDDALRIYDQYMSLATSAELGSENTRLRFAEVYEKLLIACARTQPPPMASVIRLLDDMRTLSLDFTSNNLISLLVLLMRASPDHISAYNVYSHFHALNPNAIDHAGFSAILTTFLNLSWKHSPLTPPDLLISMMKDMDRAGYSPSPYILSSLLKQYGQFATRARRGNTAESEENIGGIAKAIRDVHTLVKLDPLISPDVPLLTALMDAYGRVGAFFEAFEVWDELVQRRAREPRETVQEVYGAAINVMLDTCGWSYSLGKARKSWGWARRWGLVWEKKQWDGWIECLCRCGEVEEAGHVVLEEMGSGAIPPPDKETVRLLYKFGRKQRERGRNVAGIDRLMVGVRERWPQWVEELSSERGLTRMSKGAQ
ncbi:hypothetical protein C362_02596 [Cryptococcus neoformans Bt1]|nr:hypothetical protein C362_02596 [Cryptococcus neoformans var. grubii Bt1]